MDKKPLIGISIGAMVLLVIASLGNVVGYQTVQSLNQQTIKERISQRDLLFQTICDIVNNKEIQRIILKSQVSRGIFLASEMPVLTKNQLRRMYFLGLILSKVISRSRMQSMVGKYQFNNPEMQKEISTVFENDKILNTELSQIKDSECDCGNQNTIRWGFPIICTIAIVLYNFALLFFNYITLLIGVVALMILDGLDCPSTR